MRRGILTALLLITMTHLLWAASDHVPGRLIIKTQALAGLSSVGDDDSLPSINDTVTSLGAEQLSTFTPNLKESSVISTIGEETYIVDFPEGSNLDIISDELRKRPDITQIERDYYVYVSDIPDDPFATLQVHFSGSDLHHVLDIPEHNDIIVAVVDTGVNYLHQDLNNNIYINTDEIPDNNIDDDGNGYIDDRYGYNFYNYISTGGSSNPSDGHGHGTHIAGLISAENDNQVGVSGLNSRAKILGIRFLNSFGQGTQSSAAAAIYYAVNEGARVINCSWGYSQITSLLADAVNYAISNGVMVVAASGNDGHSQLEYPAALPHVISIGSVNTNKHVSHFSNTGSHIDFAMYGEGILSLGLSTYSFKTGTSQSAGIMSGIIGRVLSADDELSQAQVLNILVNSSTDIGSPGRDNASGYGVVSGSALKSHMLSLLNGEDIPENDDSPNINSDDSLNVTRVLNFPNPVRSYTTKFGFESSAGGNATVKIFDRAGYLVQTLSQSVSTGYNTIEWDSRNKSGNISPNGAYFYVLEVDADNGKSITKGKMALLN